MDSKIEELYGSYRRGALDRRVFLKQLAFFAGGTAAAMAILPELEASALSSPLYQDDNDLKTGFVSYPGETGDMKAFRAYPAKGSKFPAVIVIHENRGLVPHIREVAKRMAREGFLALAPDALSPVGGTPDDISNFGELFKKI